MGLSYVIGIPLGYGLVGMWIGFALDENIRGIILMRRWRSGKWRDKGFVKEQRVATIKHGEVTHARQKKKIFLCFVLAKS